jgi:hypothetical protein
MADYVLASALELVALTIAFALGVFWGHHTKP